MKSTRLLWLVVILFGFLEVVNIISFFPTSVTQLDADNFIGTAIMAVGAFGYFHGVKIR